MDIIAKAIGLFIVATIIGVAGGIAFGVGILVARAIS